MASLRWGRPEGRRRLPFVAGGSSALLLLLLGGESAMSPIVLIQVIDDTCSIGRREVVTSSAQGRIPRVSISDLGISAAKSTPASMTAGAMDGAELMARFVGDPEQAYSACLIHGLGAIRGLQFAEDVAQVFFDRLFTDEQMLANIPIGKTSRYQPQHFDFARLVRRSCPSGSGRLEQLILDLGQQPPIYAAGATGRCMPQERGMVALVHEDADVTGRFTERKRPIQCFEGGGMVAIALVRQRLEHQNLDEVAGAIPRWPLRRLLRLCGAWFVVSNKEPHEREVLVYPLVHRWQIRIEVAAIRPATYQRELTCRQPEPRLMPSAYFT